MQPNSCWKLFTWCKHWTRFLL